jgi:excinuclease UvrABC nuclease subunit
MLKRSEVLSLPTVDIHDRHAIPKLPAVYFLVTSDKILYIGGTKNLFNRWRNADQHNKYSEAVSAKARLAWVTVQTEEEAFALEKETVKALQPIWNERLKDDLARISFRASGEAEQKVAKMIMSEGFIHAGLPAYGKFFRAVASGEIVISKTPPEVPRPQTDI